MRLGGRIFQKHDSPDSWVAAVRAAGYKAAYCPIGDEADESTVQAYARAAAAANIVIGEVSAFGNNPISPDEAVRKRSLAKCQARLALAERIGARCCVNCAGSLGPDWAGQHPANLTQATFDLIVASCREIIDAVRPTRTFYTLETMPWMYPDSADSYLRLIAAIDRPAFAVHFDPVNIVCSPQIYFNTGAFLRDAFDKLGPHIRSCHAKDIVLENHLTVHLSEVRPGEGCLDYRTYLRELNKLDCDISLMIEHLREEDQFKAAADHIRAVAKEEGMAI
ncbi:MAG: sugar phosphate isomerase/epimerase [Kiritimatiellae bacterium]|nr:sugar phosphate isomerase/epimerase [Kiritimatiellia bacterium]